MHISTSHTSTCINKVNLGVVSIKYQIRVSDWRLCIERLVKKEFSNLIETILPADWAAPEHSRPYAVTPVR